MDEYYYPNSSRKKRHYEESLPQAPVKDEEGIDLGKPRMFLVNGQPQELYPVGALARALNRKPVTVRKWESEGIIPRSPFLMPSHDPRGQRRLYTRQQVDDLRRIAQEEGILEPSPGGKWRSVEKTAFKEKALKVFR